MPNELDPFDKALVKRLTTLPVAVAADLKSNTTIMLYSPDKQEILKVPFSVLVAAIKAS